MIPVVNVQQKNENNEDDEPNVKKFATVIRQRRHAVNS